MKIKKKSGINIKRNILVVVSVLLIASAFLVYTYSSSGSLFGWHPFGTAKDKNAVNYDKPTDEQKQAGDTIKEQSVGKTDTTTSDDPSSPEPQANGKSTVDVTITAKNKNGSLLQIRSLIGTISSSGTCTLTLSKGSAVITKTAGIQPQASESTCKGFDVPLGELSTGNWQINLRFENDSLQGTAEGSVAI